MNEHDLITAIEASDLPRWAQEELSELVRHRLATHQARRSGAAKTNLVNQERAEAQAARIRAALGVQPFSPDRATKLQRKISAHPRAYGFTQIPSLPTIRRVLREVEAERNKKENTVSRLSLSTGNAAYSVSTAST